MAEQQRDLPTDNDNGRSDGRDVSGTAEKVKLSKKILTSLKSFGFLGTIFIGIIIAVVIFLILIGIVGFFLEMPGLMSEKLTDLKNGFFNSITTWFGKDNTVFIKPEQEKELAEYLENMGYPPYEFGFGKYEEDDDENSFSIDSKYLNAYLLADYNTYQPYDAMKANVSSFFHNLGSGWGKLFGEEVDKDSGTQELHFGMLNFDRGLYEGGNWDDFLNSIKIDMENKLLTFTTLDWDGAIPRFTSYTYNMEGWSTRYGKPLVLSLTLHLATMAPDLAYRVIMDEGENTKINIGRTAYDIRIKLKYQNLSGETTNFGAIDESLADLDGKTEYTTEDFLKIKNFIETHQADDPVIEGMQLAQQNLNVLLNTSFNDTMSSTEKWNPDGARYLYANLTDAEDMSGYNNSPTYEYSVYMLGRYVDAAISQAKEKAEEIDKEVTFNAENYEELIGTSAGITFDYDTGEPQADNSYSMDENTGIFKAYQDKLIEICKEKDIKSSEELVENEEAKEEAYNFIRDQLTELYDTKMRADMDIIYELSGDDKVVQLQEELDKIGLSLSAINRALYYNDSRNSNEDGEKLTKIQPYIESVTEHWYKNVYFTIDAAEKYGEEDYIAENYPDWEGAYTSNDSQDTVEYEFEPTAGTDDEILSRTEKGLWIVIETNESGGGLQQVADAVRGETNQHTKELFQGTAGKPAKYFVYDGSTKTAEKIDELREVYNAAYSAEWDISRDDDLAVEAAEEAVEEKEEEDGTNYFKEVDVRANALSAFTILENDPSEDAEYILRDLKNLFVDLEYFTKEELRTKDTHVFQWPISGYFNPYWPQKRFEKQQVDYGTIIRSKVSTDNIRNGLNADGSERTDSQQQSSIYGPNLNADATAGAVDTSVPDLDDENEEENEITNPTDTLVDGFESGLNVLSPVTGEIIEEGSDYIKIKVLDNTAISEYEPFYSKYEDVCTGYIMYIKGFQKTAINSSSASEYKKVTHTDAYFTQNGYSTEEMEKWRADEDKRLEAPAYIERDGKKYIKEGTVIGTTTNSDIVMYLINRENSIVEDVESYIRLAKKGIDTDFPEEFIFWLGVLLEGGCEGQYDLGEYYGVEVLADGAGNTTAFGLTKAIAGVGDVPEMYPNFAEHLASGRVPKEEAQGVFLLVLEAGRESVLEQIENDDALSESELDALVDLNHASPSECSQVCDIFNERGALTLQDFEEHWGTNTNYEETLRRRGHVRGMLATAEEYRNPYSASTPKYTFLSETPWSDFINGTPSADLYTLEGS